ncbi:DUF928 domain-containing protein [Leptolyngbya sp. Heron Island J]|uniref:DUF928 domain-containing protein n=1 Tax=Leptolyngbya sp. Heron Island J TaxID=1385935 RepID=UPI0003F4E929|nr:DUF928 domain-containing protein [Leptolyngbya sp. Heron Island J]
MPSSYAGERIRWTPDSDRGSVESTLSGGRRGQAAVSCNAAHHATQLALLIPKHQDSLLTTRAQPTLAWQITTATPVSMTFHLSDPDLATPIYTRALQLEKTSVVSLTLPENYHLTAGKRYRWTVFVSCPGDHQAEISARSFVEYVDRESLDVNHLSNLEQARAYADRGIWYDAIAVLLTGNHEETDAETMVQSLLEQGESSAEATLSAVVHL